MKGGKIDVSVVLLPEHASFNVLLEILLSIEL